jgi:hypothetical protein
LLIAMTPTLQLSRHKGSRRVEMLTLPSWRESRPRFSNAHWRISHTEIPTGANCTRHQLRAEVTSGTAQATSISLTLACENWSEDIFVFVPGAIYAGNRFVVRPQPYPPMP